MDNLNKISYGFLKTTGGISVPGIITNGILEIFGAGEEFSLVSHWPLDLSSYNQPTHQFADKGPGENHGTGYGTNLGGTFDFVNNHHGTGGGATPFNGSDDYINCGNDASLNITGALSFAAWIRPSSLAAYNLIIGKSTDSDYDIGIANGGASEIRFHSGDGIQEFVSSIGASIATGVWRHIVAVRTVTPNEVTFYIDGQPLNTASFTRTPVGSTANVYIGMRGDTAWPFNGHLSDVRLYDHALSQGEVTILFLEKALGFMERFEVLKSIRNIVQITKGRSLKV